MAAEIQLIYFNARGRMECSRLILAAAGQKYDDVRLTPEQWAAEKPNTPFGQLPVYVEGGQKYGQSIAIATYLARKHGFYGKSHLDGLCIGQVVHLIDELLTIAAKAYHEKDEAKKAELMKTFKETDIPKYLNLLEGLLKKSGTGHFLGKELTLADIACYDILYSFGQRKLLSTDGYPLLTALVKTVENHPNIKAYLATRQQTEN